eukprot:TRINITY_DN64235_c0_g8_i1.p1 TRINITY_DN64235_c0_g8~~TRINITY_DN64235_c0_g8_i1.p1  ORF type:complete len:193 (+),score=21.12 TRINITY_DN64235_c0_g8_i1:71-649(+)
MSVASSVCSLPPIRESPSGNVTRQKLSKAETKRRAASLKREIEEQRQAKQAAATKSKELQQRVVELQCQLQHVPKAVNKLLFLEHNDPWELKRRAKTHTARDYAGNVIYTEKPQDDEEVYVPSVYNKYKNADWGEDPQPTGAGLDLAGKSSRPTKFRMKNQSVRRTRHYYDYEGKSYMVDLQDPPDVWNQYC